MTKAQLTALIQAIQQTAIFMFQNGISVRNAIASTDADSTYVSGLISDYSSEIDDIISDIPDDPETPDVNPDEPQDGGET